MSFIECVLSTDAHIKIFGRRRTRLDHAKKVAWIWAPFATAATLHGVFSHSPDRVIEAAVFFSSVTVVANIMLASGNIQDVAVVFGPWQLIAAAFCAYLPPPTDRRIAIVVAIMLVPVVLFSILVLRTILMALYKTLSWVLRKAMVILPSMSSVVHTCSLGHLVIRPPRFRNTDAFVHCELCGNCRRAILRSSLLSGSRLRLTKIDEKIFLFSSLDEMQRSWKNCELCEALLNSKIQENDRQHASKTNYGTMHPASPPVVSEYAKDQRVFLHIRYRRSLHRLSEDLLEVILAANCGTKFSPLLVSEGMCCTSFRPLAKLSMVLTVVSNTPGLWKESRQDDVAYTGSPQIFDQIQIWIRECSRHKHCQPPKSSPHFLPARLIFVGTREKPELRLVHARQGMPSDQIPQYIALSHCWGGDIACKLTTENHSAMRTSLSEDSLPKNFLDAVRATRHLGIPYLWIDSLCILQDSSRDWAEQSPTMGQVFASAYCVIAATASENSYGGCFRNRPVHRVERNIMTSATQRCYVVSSGTPSIRTLFDTRVEAAPLTKRAWAFQERLLARRLVHFCSDAVLFECNTIQASELNPAGIEYDREAYAIRDGKLISWFERTVLNPLVKWSRPVDLDDSERARRGIRGALDTLQSLGQGSELPTQAETIEICKRWFDIVSAYSEGALTRQTDKLVALSGIAELVQGSLQASYVAGLWKLGTKLDTLKLQLLWVAKEPHERQALYCAPSWSWASVNGRIGLLPRDVLETTRLAKQSIGFLARVRGVDMLYGDGTGTKAGDLVDRGSLTVEGPILEVSMPSGNSQLINLGGEGSPRRKGLAASFFPDWTSTGDLRGGLVALHIMTVQHSDRRPRHYGLVLQPRLASIEPLVGTGKRLPGRRLSGPHRTLQNNGGSASEPVCYERVGIWMASQSLGGCRSASSTPDQIGPRPNWQMQEVTIV